MKLAFGRALGKFLTDSVTKPTGKILKDLVIGRKVVGGFSGPVRGSRMRWKGPADKLTSWRTLSPKQVAEMSADPNKKRLIKYMKMDGKKVPVARKQTVGGIAGFAHRRPVLTAGGVGAAYLLAKANKNMPIGMPQRQMQSMRSQMGPYIPLSPDQGGL